MFKDLFVADIKMMFRNKQAIFWAFMFPLMFSLIFGLFFGKSAKSGTVSVINKSDSEISTSYVKALKESDIYKIIEDIDEQESVDQIKSGKIVGSVVIPENFGKQPAQQLSQDPRKMQAPPVFENQFLKLIVDPGSPQVNAALQGFTDKFLSEINLKIQNGQTIYSYNVEKTNDKKLSYYDFILAGILGLSIMNSSIIGIAVAMTKYREDKILKRITSTPLPTWIFIISEVLSRLILNLLQIMTILAIGVFVFDANIYGNIFVLIGISLFGAILFQLMGFVIAALSKTTDAAQGMATAITIPMMFLAGVFFPIDSLPRWIANIVQYLPLAPLLRIIRGIALESQSPFSDPKNIIIIGAWITGCLLISIFKFRLTEE